MKTKQVIPTFKPIQIAAAISLMMIATALNVSAIPITPLSPGDLDPGATVITFAGLPVFSQPTSVGGVGFVLANGAGPDVAFDPSPPRQFGPSEGTIIQNIVSGFLSMNMNFPSQLHQLGFDLRTFPAVTLNLTFTSHGTTVESLSLPTQNTSSSPNSTLYFYGFQSTVPFDHVLLGVSGPSASFFEMDNVAFSPVPDASTSWALLAPAVTLLVLARRRLRSPVGA